jgi:hypothetical protein
MSTRYRLAMQLLKIRRIVWLAGPVGVTTQQVVAKTGLRLRTVQRALGALASDPDFRVLRVVDGQRGHFFVKAERRT